MELSSVKHVLQLSSAFGPAKDTSMLSVTTTNLFFAVYNKLARETTTSPCSHNQKAPQTQMPTTSDPEYDDIVSTTNLKHRDEQPASPANMADYYDDVIPRPSYKCTPHPPNHDTPVAYANVDSLTHNELSGSRTNGEEDKSNNRNLVLFDDPSYAVLPLISSDNGNKTGQF